MTDINIMDESPIRKIRKSVGKSMVDFAIDLDISYTHLTALEHSTADSISPGLLDKLQHYTNTEELQSEYLKFKKQLRIHNCRQLNKDLSRLRASRTMSPMVFLASYWNLPSTSALSKVLCISHGLLYRVVHGELRSLPMVFTQAFEDVGIPADIIEEIELGVNEYYDYTNFSTQTK